MDQVQVCHLSKIQASNKQTNSKREQSETHRQILLNKNQHGFCKGKSCLTNLLEFFESTHRHVDRNELVDTIYLDF